MKYAIRMMLINPNIKVTSVEDSYPDTELEISMNRMRKESALSRSQKVVDKVISSLT